MRGQGQSPHPVLSSWADEFRISNASWQAVVEAVASPSKEIIFTTFKGTNQEMLKMNANFFYYLLKAGVASNILLMSEDEDSCAALWDAGIPCWVDQLCPRGEELPAGIGSCCAANPCLPFMKVALTRLCSTCC